MSPRPPKPTGTRLAHGPGWAIYDGPKTPPRLHLEAEPVDVHAVPRGNVKTVVGLPYDLWQLIQEALERRG